jgi:hypothetical protein
MRSKRSKTPTITLPPAQDIAVTPTAGVKASFSMTDPAGIVKARVMRASNATRGLVKRCFATRVSCDHAARILRSPLSPGHQSEAREYPRARPDRWPTFSPPGPRVATPISRFFCRTRTGVRYRQLRVSPCGLKRAARRVTRQIEEGMWRRPERL